MKVELIEYETELGKFYYKVMWNSEEGIGCELFDHNKEGFLYAKKFFEKKKRGINPHYKIIESYES